MRFEKIWIEQCRATRAPLGTTRRSRAGLPRFPAAMWRVFNEYDLAGYVAIQKPTVRRQLRARLYFS